jgi:hypothetical protein
MDGLYPMKRLFCALHVTTNITQALYSTRAIQLSR